MISPFSRKQIEKAKPFDVEAPSSRRSKEEASSPEGFWGFVVTVVATLFLYLMMILLTEGSYGR